MLTPTATAPFFTHYPISVSYIAIGNGLRWGRVCEKALESKKHHFQRTKEMCVVGTEGAGKGPAQEETGN